jgi:hypothetical protein
MCWNTRGKETMQTTAQLLSIVLLAVFYYVVVHRKPVYALNSIVERPRYDKRLPPYAVDITEVVSKLTLGYQEGGAQTSDFFDITYEPDWKQPPDVLVRYTVPEDEESLENSWVRNQGNVSNAGVTMDDVIDSLMSTTAYNAPDSIKSVKVTSPWPYPTYFEIKSYESDLATEVGEKIPGWVYAGSTTGDIDVVGKVKDDLLNGAVYLAVEHYWYRKDDPLNVMYQNGDADGVIIPFPGKDPRNQKPFFGAVSIDSYNFVDRYGLIAAMTGGLTDLAGSFAQQAGILQQTSGVRGLAKRYGIDAIQVGAILGMGMYFEWIDENSMMEHLIPSLAAGFADEAAGWAVNQLPDKYTKAIIVLGGQMSTGDVLGAGTSAAALLLYLRMMDDVALHVEF